MLLKCSPYVNGCDVWCVSHFLMYVLLGIFAPKYFFLIFSLGVYRIWCENNGVMYIKSKGVEDVVTNTMGLVVGVMLSRCL